MLTNFLQHTRCPEAALSSLQTWNSFLDPDSPIQRKITTDNKIIGIASPSEAKELLSILQASADGNIPTIGTLSDIDGLIGLLRLEKYIDSGMSGKETSGAKALIRHGYYLLRPLFPVAFRKYLQRIALRDWESMPFPVWPVDLSIENLMESIWKVLLRSQEIDELPFIWFWPEGHSSACIMTHDVETAVGRDFCNTMMGIERRHDITSAFEVVPEERYGVPDQFLDEIRAGGCEVCIHGLNHDGHLFSSDTIFFERAKKINAYAKKWGALGFRSPVLYRNLDWLHALDFSYDMSVPNVGHLDPQRGGCCTVMPYFIGDILELPLTTIQDYSLFNILQQRSLDIWVNQIEKIRSKHGLISFIVHPDYVNEKWSSQLYDRLLGQLAELRSEGGVWIALPREVDSWWRARHEMRLTRQDGTWKISGAQADRARIAYASIVNGKVVYRVEKDQPVAAKER